MPQEVRFFTQREVSDIVQKKKSGGFPRCPDCGGILRVKELQISGRAVGAGPWDITCRQCGARGNSD